MLGSSKRAKVARRLTATSTTLLVTSAMACSLFTDLDGLQSGAGAPDASTNDDFVASDASVIDGGGRDAVADQTTVDASAGAIAFVQGNAIDYPDGGTGTITLNPVVPGNTIIVALVLSGDASATVTDDQADSYTLVDGPFGQTNAKRDYIFAAIATAGNAKTMTVALTGSSQDVELYAMEYSGVTAFDSAINNYGTGGLIHSGFVTTAVANELLFVWSDDGSVTVGAGFTARNQANDDLIADEIAGPAGAYEATSTVTGNAEIMLAAFR